MNNKTVKILSYILVAALASALTFGATAMLEEKPIVTNSKLEALQQLLEDRFIGDVDETVIIDAAASAMVDALGDRWSYYISAAEYAAFDEDKKNAYVGIGVTVTSSNQQEGLLITVVNPDGPADKAGIQINDVVVGVDGKDVRKLDTTAISNMIRGEIGTQVAITVLREGKELTLTVTRDTVKTVVAEGQMLEDGIGLVSIKNFNTGCADATIAAVESLLKQGAEKLIFDVRNNGGGYSHEMTDTLDYLLPEGLLFRTVDYEGKESRVESDAKCLDIPMVVLINENSYSAAEFFAAALWEYGAAKTVGVKTVGKGYYQVTFRLNDGSAVGLSIGKYFTPQGKNLQNVGITPDYPAPVETDVANAILSGVLKGKEDPQILAAMNVLKDWE